MPWVTRDGRVHKRGLPGLPSSPAAPGSQRSQHIRFPKLAPRLQCPDDHHQPNSALEPEEMQRSHGEEELKEAVVQNVSARPSRSPFPRSATFLPSSLRSSSYPSVIGGSRPLRSAAQQGAAWARIPSPSSPSLLLLRRPMLPDCAIASVRSARHRARVIVVRRAEPRGPKRRSCGDEGGDVRNCMKRVVTKHYMSNEDQSQAGEPALPNATSTNWSRTEEKREREDREV